MIPTKINVRKIIVIEGEDAAGMYNLVACEIPAYFSFYVIVSEAMKWLDTVSVYITHVAVEITTTTHIIVSTISVDAIIVEDTTVDLLKGWRSVGSLF